MTEICKCLSSLQSKITIVASIGGCSNANVQAAIQNMPLY